MKKNLLMIAVVAAVLCCACSNDNDELRQAQESLEQRVSDLEEWQKSVNEDLASLRQIVSSLENGDYVTGVTELSDGTGYVISFKNSGAVTIKNGKDGASPAIGTKQEDGKYYWTLDGQWMLDAAGKKLPVTGQAPLIQVNYSTGCWEISYDGGNGWQNTGVKAQGDSMFAANGVDNTNPAYVELTLAGGTKIQLPRYAAIKIGSDAGNEALAMTTQSLTIPLTLPSGFKESDYSAIVAELKNSDGMWMDMQTRAYINDFWGVKVNKPTFTSGKYDGNASVTVYSKYVPASTSDKALLLEVSLVDSKGQKETAARVINVDIKAAVGDFYYSDGTYSQDYDADKRCIGIVFYAGDVAKDDDALRQKIGDTSTGSHGLVIALQPILTGSTKWGAAYKLTTSVGQWIEANTAYKSCTYPLDRSLQKFMGYNNTQGIKAYNRPLSPYDVNIVGYVQLSYDVPYPTSSSGWYVPSVGELLRLLTLGELTETSSAKDHENLKYIRERATVLKQSEPETDLSLFLYNDRYATSTESTKKDANGVYKYAYDVDASFGYGAVPCSKRGDEESNVSGRLFPVLAF